MAKPQPKPAKKLSELEQLKLDVKRLTDELEAHKKRECDEKSAAAEVRACEHALEGRKAAVAAAKENLAQANQKLAAMVMGDTQTSWIKPAEGLRWSNAKRLETVMGLPWRLALALQADGWYLRSDIIWHKRNPMPESVNDRPTRSHEYLFLLTKSAKYSYDAAVIRERATVGNHHRNVIRPQVSRVPGKSEHLGLWKTKDASAGRNRRSVWTIPTKPFKGAHFAVFPPKLVEPCILAGCPAGGTVLDCFSGSGTTGVVALQHGRHYIGIELNPTYAADSRKRLSLADPIGQQQTIEGVA